MNGLQAAGGSSLSGTGSLAGPGQARHLMHLEVTMVTCRENVTTPTPDCEADVLEALLRGMPRLEAQQQLQAGGERRPRRMLCCIVMPALLRRAMRNLRGR